ncbi:hypothetical protein B0T20DRAFT_384499 [Sordaria brevicollis]|uniref:CipC-like antibiotic response protein n=1 Tax=Sordaria brevicollis TaxID=83679 RepID=A0AAE0P2Y9_SORBR|nr:hypothetical protein B0T20DRAFT_384499 [Sordaria brevicollis]
MPFDFDEAKSAHSQLYSPSSTPIPGDDFDPSSIHATQHFRQHLDEARDKPKFSHELLGGAVAFEAMHMWEKQQRREGRPVHHAVAKEALAALAAAEVDKMIEKRGLRGNVDREEARRDAREKITGLYDRQYGGGQEGGMWDP